MFTNFAKFDTTNNEKFCVAWTYCCLSTNKIFAQLLLICETQKMLIKKIKFDWIYFEIDKNDWNILKNNFYTQKSMLFFYVFENKKQFEFEFIYIKSQKKACDFVKLF